MNWRLIYSECYELAFEQEYLFMIWSEYCGLASEQVGLFVPISHQTLTLLCYIAIHHVKYCTLSSTFTPTIWIMRLPDPLGQGVCS